MKKIEISPKLKMNEIIEYAISSLSVGKSPHTQKALLSKGKQLIKSYGSLTVGNMTLNDWATHEREFNAIYSEKTLEHYNQINTKVIELLINEGVLEKSPFKFKKASFNNKVSRKPPCVYSMSEIQQLLSFDQSCLAETYLLQFGLATGLRIGELLALNEESYDKEAKTYTVDLTLSTKLYKAVDTGKSMRQVELNNTAIEAIENLITLSRRRPSKVIEVLLSDNETYEKQNRTLLAFNTKRHEVFSAVNHFTSDYFKENCEKSGVKYIPPMNIRHTYASQLICQGVSLVYVARQMGHSVKELAEKQYTSWIKEVPEDVHLIINNHFKLCSQIKITEAANDEVYIQDNVVRPNFFYRLINKLFAIKVG